MTSSDTRYTRTAIALHWLIALLIIGGFVLGKIMVDMRFSPVKLQYYAWHKWIGITVFLLAVLRVAWRAGHRPPAPLAAPAWQMRAASVTHLMMYFLLFAIPLSGWLFSSASGFKTVYLGLLPIPDLLAKGSGLKDITKTVHEVLTFLLLGLFVLHVGAALKHALVDKDATLARMMPRMNRPE